MRWAWVLGVLVACGGGEDREPLAPTEERPATPPEPIVPDEPTEPEPVEPAPEPVDGRIDAHRMRGPARSLCGAVRRVTESSNIDCERIGLRVREDSLLQERWSLDPTGPWLAAHFVELRYDPEDIDSFCLLLTRTSAGWFADDLGGLLCNNSGSVRVDVGATGRWETMGPDGAPRLVVEVSESMSHFVDGDSDVESILICGENEGRVACHRMTVGATHTHGPGSEIEGEPTPSWTAGITFLPRDRIRVAEHSAPDTLPTRPPSAGLYQLRF